MFVLEFPAPMSQSDQYAEENRFQLVGVHSEGIVVSITLLCTLLAVLTLIRLLYHGTKAKAYMPESVLLIVIGLVVGLIFGAINDPSVYNYVDFPYQIYLSVFIPIIIFEAAYFMSKSAFAHNIAEILVYAVVGTLLSTAIIGGLLIATKEKFQKVEFTNADLLTFASLISAVDPVAVIAIMEQMHVNENLYMLCFGESTLNDGVSAVLFNLFKGIDSLTAQNISIGSIVGLGIAKFLISVFGAFALSAVVSFIFCLLSRLSYKIHNVQALIMMITPVLCYCLSDMFLFSGIIGVMTSALILQRYTENNFSQLSIVSFKHIMHMLAQTCETLLFLRMGMQLGYNMLVDVRKVDPLFVTISIPYTIIARSVATVLQTAFLNIQRRKIGQQLTWRDQIILVLAGLRGGMAFALAKAWALPDNKSSQVVFATGVLNLFTILVYGLTIRPIITALKIKLQVGPGEGENTLYVQKTLMRPANNIYHFIKHVSRHDNDLLCRRCIKNADQCLQRMFLNNPLPMDRALIHNINEIKEQISLKFQSNVMRRLGREKKGAIRKRLKSIIGLNTTQDFDDGSINRSKSISDNISQKRHASTVLHKWELDISDDIITLPNVKRIATLDVAYQKDTADEHNDSSMIAQNDK